jgi:hypothetical protein
MRGIGFLLGGAVGVLWGPAKATSEVVRQHLALFPRRVVVCPRILLRARTLSPIIKGDQGSKSRAQLAA